MPRTSSPPRLVVVGSSNTDMVVQAPSIPRPGETIIGGEFIQAAGGKGANQAVAAARLGAQVVFVGRVGADALGDSALAGLQAEGIDTQHVVRDADAPSGVALIIVDDKGENSITVAPGANARLTAADVEQAAAAIDACDALLVQLETPLPSVGRAIALARSRGKRVVLNPAPYQWIPASLLADVEVLTPNETEASQLLDGRPITPDIAPAAAQTLRDMGVDSVIITAGRAGACIAAAEGDWRVPAFTVEAVDTTAAGDAFSAALTVALAEGQPLAAAARFAAAAAALTVTQRGAQPSLPDRETVEGFLASNQ